MLEHITKQIISSYSPEKILLFGSQAKGISSPHSDIDLCVVATTSNKRKLLTEMYYSIESEKPIDILLYTPQEWDECIADKTSFAYKINHEGVRLYG
ncbi:MAG: nucleotidyltransferase domain-containing protein [Firmicutes bacterium]|nr:nucleotidyltransferase domain-containing protein [Bacillota bacterium]